MAVTFPNAPVVMPPLPTAQQEPTTPIEEAKPSAPSRIQPNRAKNTSLRTPTKSNERNVLFGLIVRMANEVIEVPWHQSFIVLVIQLASLWPLFCYVKGEGWGPACQYGQISGCTVGGMYLVRILRASMLVLADFCERTRRRIPIDTTKLWKELSDGECTAFGWLCVLPTLGLAYFNWKLAVAVGLTGGIFTGICIILFRFIDLWLQSVPDSVSPPKLPKPSSDFSFLVCGEIFLGLHGWAVILGLFASIFGSTWAAGMTSLILLPYYLCVAAQGAILFLDEQFPSTNRIFKALATEIRKTITDRRCKWRKYG